LKNVCCRLFPRWITWWGKPGATAPAIRAMHFLNQIAFLLSIVYYGVHRIINAENEAGDQAGDKISAAFKASATPGKNKPSILMEQSE